MTEQLLRVKEVAEILGTTEGTVRAWIFYKKLRTVKLGRAVRVPAEWLDEFIKSQTRYEKEE